MMIRLSPQRRALLQRLAVPILVLLSVAAILIGKADEAAFAALRIALADALVPAFATLSRPLAALHGFGARVEDAVFVYRENGRLRRENKRLLHWQETALALASENAQLRGLLKLVPAPAVSFVTARVVAGSGGAYVRSLLIDAGRKNGVARDQAAITGTGLVGRVAAVGRRAARVRLLTDLDSRIPVTVGAARVRAILAGDNSARPVLQYLPSSAHLAIGDRVVTSGEGGVFPPDLPVGVVAALTGAAPRVALYAAPARTGYLRIVDYGLAGGLPKPVAAPRENRSRSAGPVAESVR
ncbi:MAG: rod shape-determining protein MreC [Stellaceae bacterium]